MDPSFQVMGDMLDKILTPLRMPSQASVQDDAITEEVFDKGKLGTSGSRSSSSSSTSSIYGKHTIHKSVKSAGLINSLHIINLTILAKFQDSLQLHNYNLKKH